MNKHTCTRSWLLCLWLVAFLCPTARGADTLVLFDQGHGQRFLVEGDGELDLSRLAALIKEKGAAVGSVTGTLTASELAGAKALIISGPFKEFSADEIDAVVKFVQEGGRVAVMLHISPPASSLLSALGVITSRGVVSEQENLLAESALDFHVTRLEPHPLWKGMSRFAVYGSWAVKNKGMDGLVIGRTGPTAWMDLNRNRKYDAGEPVESMGIVVAVNPGQGSLLAFADDAIFQNRFLEKENLELARNLAGWLLE